MNLKVVFIGSGNLAKNLAKNFYQNGISVLQIYSRSIIHAEELALKVHAKAIDKLDAIDATADLIIICTTDAAIDEIVQKLTFEPKLIVHTAGSISMDVFKKFNNYGVFYPLQSFSKQVFIEMSNIPICVEANNNKNKTQLINLANSISQMVYEINSEQRKACHLAAVYANNFANHMFSIAERILEQHQLPFEIIKPLITETANKVQSLSPMQAQTGPAVRNDLITQHEHLSMLHSTHLKKIYTFVSESIYKFNSNT